MFFLFLFLSIYGYSASDCAKCSWPRESTVNQRGQCVIGWGNQSGLDVTCHNWCLTQNAEGYALPTDLILPSKSSTGEQCVCKWYDESNNLQYITRPINNCPASWIGPSDDNLNSWAADDFFNSQNKQQDDNAGWSKSGEDSPFHAAGDVSLSGGLTGHVYMDDVIKAIDYRAQSVYGAVSLSFSPRFNHVDSALSGLRDSLGTLSAIEGNRASSSQLSGVQDNLMYAINSRTGGGASSSDVSDAFARTAASIDALRDALASDSGSGEGTDLSGVLSGIRSIKTSVDSSAHTIVDDARDREHRALYSDSAAHWAYMDYLDSMYSSGSGGGGSGSGGGSGASTTEGIGFLTDSGSRASGALFSFLQAVNNLTTIGASCSDGTISGGNVDVTLWGKYELKVDFSPIWTNHIFQTVLSFMRLMAGLTGAIAGLGSALSVFAWLSSGSSVTRFGGGSAVG